MLNCGFLNSDGAARRPYPESARRVKRFTFFVPVISRYFAISRPKMLNTQNP
jgi:hypothetical protein